MARFKAFLLSGLLAATIYPVAGPAAGEGEGGAAVLDVDPAMFAPPSVGIGSLAASHGVPLAEIEAFVDRDRIEPGDSVTLLVTSFSGRISKQWLLELAASKLNPEELKSRPRSNQTLYSSSGNKFTFETRRVALALETWGPVPGPDTGTPDARYRRVDGHARGLVNEVFLGIGLDDTARALMQLHQARREGVVDPERRLRVTSTPVPDDVAREGLDLVSRAGLTLAHERAIAGSVPAMLEFFEVAASSRGLREILWEIMDKPSLWSIIRRFGRVETGVSFHSKGVRRLPAEPWGLPPSVTVYQIPFTLNLNDEPALNCLMIVTEARPPLLTTAGIIGISAHDPGAKQRRAMVRLLSARAAAGSAEAD